MTLTATTSTGYLARRELCTCGREFRSNEAWCPRCQEPATPALARFNMQSLRVPSQHQPRGSAQRTQVRQVSSMSTSRKLLPLAITLLVGTVVLTVASILIAALTSVS